MAVENKAYRPLPIRMINNNRKLIRRLGLLNDADTTQAYMQRASDLCGLDDYGALDFLPAFEKLLESLRNEARLNVIGSLSINTYLLQLLRYRLLLQENRKKNPNITEQSIREPVFILGLPRTGSTILFELLAQDEAFQSPLTWEVMYPVFLEDNPAQKYLNQIKSMFSVGFVQKLAPEYRKIHEIGTYLPQECIAIQSLAFQSIQFHTTYSVDSYQNWLEASHWSPAYRIHKEFLQHLQFTNRDASTIVRQWLLKAPGHLYSMETLFACYPDAKIIQTHRNPVDVIPSIASLSATLRQAFSDHVSLIEAGKFSAKSWHKALSRSLLWRDSNSGKESQFLDIHYKDFISDQLKTIEQIYQFLEKPFTDTTRERILKYLNRKPQNRHGGHKYNLVDYGLSLEEEQMRYQDYIDRFRLL